MNKDRQYRYLDEGGNLKEEPYDAKKCKPLDRVLTFLENKFEIHAGELGDKKAQEQLKFYREHPQVHDVNAGEDKNSCVFEIEVFADSEEKGANELDQFTECFSVANEMGEEDLRKVMIYFGIPVAPDASAKTMRVRLMSPKDGLVRIGDARLEKFKKVFVDKLTGAEKEENDLKLLIRTALNDGHIEKDKGPYMMGDVMLGTSEKDVVVYLRNNPQFKAALIQKVNPKAEAAGLDEFTDEERVIIDTKLEELKVKSKARATDVRFEDLKAAQAEKGETVLTREKLRELAQG